jgi:NADH dehydrogenase
LKNYVRTWFNEHGVIMRPHANITQVEKGLVLDRGEEIETDMIIWTAGIQPSLIVQQLEVAKDSQGRISLDSSHQIPNYPNVFVVGDCASLPFAPSAQLAEAQGQHIAQILLGTWAGETTFKLPPIKLKGVLGSLGKNHGFGLVGERTLIGRIPRVLKSGVLWMYKHHLG